MLKKEILRAAYFHLIGMTAMKISLVGIVLVLTLKVFAAADSTPVIKAPHNRVSRAFIWKIFIGIAAKDNGRRYSQAVVLP